MFHSSHIQRAEAYISTKIDVMKIKKLHDIVNRCKNRCDAHQVIVTIIHIIHMSDGNSLPQITCTLILVIVLYHVYTVKICKRYHNKH